MSKSPAYSFLSFAWSPRIVVTLDRMHQPLARLLLCCQTTRCLVSLATVTSCHYGHGLSDIQFGSTLANDCRHCRNPLCQSNKGRYFSFHSRLLPRPITCTVVALGSQESGDYRISRRSVSQIAVFTSKQRSCCRTMTVVNIFLESRK